MAKNRRTLAKSVKEKVLAQYKHLCAICGAVRPQIHHIDENPENDEPLNLLPLCPNHHLTDAHNPTKKMDPLKVGLFRRYKDPQILSPQFEPLFQRLRFLLVPFDHVDDHYLLEQAGDVLKFVENLEMGAYYESKLRRLMRWPQNRASLAKNRDRVMELAVELLRYQSWPLYTPG
jgi:hypothetical protein